MGEILVIEPRMKFNNDIMMIIRFSSLMFFIYLVSCQDSSKPATFVDHKKIDSLKQDSINSIKIDRLDSLINSYPQKSLLFMNYPIFITKNQFENINALNIQKQKINPENIYTAYVDDQDPVYFRVEGTFQKGKLTSIDLFHYSLNDHRDRELEDLKRVKKFYISKYGQPEIKKSVIKHSKDIPRFLENDSIEYKFEHQSKIILISISKSWQHSMSSTSLTGKDILISSIPYRISYYTLDSYKFCKEIEQGEQRKNDSKIKSTKMDL